MKNWFVQHFCERKNIAICNQRTFQALPVVGRVLDCSTVALPWEYAPFADKLACAIFRTAAS